MLLLERHRASYSEVSLKITKALHYWRLYSKFCHGRGIDKIPLHLEGGTGDNTGSPAVGEGSSLSKPLPEQKKYYKDKEMLHNDKEVNLPRWHNIPTTLELQQIFKLHESIPGGDFITPLSVTDKISRQNQYRYRRPEKHYQQTTWPTSHYEALYETRAEIHTLPKCTWNIRYNNHILSYKQTSTNLKEFTSYKVYYKPLQTSMNTKRCLKYN